MRMLSLMLLTALFFSFSCKSSLKLTSSSGKSADSSEELNTPSITIDSADEEVVWAITGGELDSYQLTIPANSFEPPMSLSMKVVEDGDDSSFTIDLTSDKPLLKAATFTMPESEADSFALYSAARFKVRITTLYNKIIDLLDEDFIDERSFYFRHWGEFKFSKRDSSSGDGDEEIIDPTPTPSPTPIPDTTPPTIVTTVINGGAASRSMLTEVTLYFSEVVVIESAAFQIDQRDGGTQTVRYNLAQDDSSGSTVATLTWKGGGAYIAATKSLKDANYQLTALEAKISDSAGNPLDGNENGVSDGAGDDYLFGTLAIDNLYVLVGDFDSDYDVDNGDLAHMAGANNSVVGDANYRSDADFDGDGDIDADDINNGFLINHYTNTRDTTGY